MSIKPVVTDAHQNEPKAAPKMWRSLEELLEKPDFQSMLNREFPSQAGEFTDPLSRRTFLSLMGASLALAGATGCRQPAGLIVPNIREAEGTQPGRPQYYATSMALGGYATPVLVKSYEGRPIKIEPNPQHPSLAGAPEGVSAGTDVFAQASVLGMYDPDREYPLNFEGNTTSWEDCQRGLKKSLTVLDKGNQGSAIRLVTGLVTSPTERDLIERFLKKYPGSRWHQHEPLASDSGLEGNTLAFGQALEAHPVLHDAAKKVRADVIVAIDTDLLNQGPGHLALVRQFGDLRDAASPESMTRLYAIEPTLSVTGTKADHRLAARPSAIPALVSHLAHLVGAAGGKPAAGLDAAEEKFLQVLASDLKEKSHDHTGKKLAKAESRAGHTVVVAGPRQPKEVHALVASINAKLGNAGKTVHYRAPLAGGRPLASDNSLAQLTEDMQAGRVKFLLVFDGNPAYSAPADVAFGQELLKLSGKKECTTAYMGLYQDETAIKSQWRIPQTHYLEQWGDLLAHDGRACLVQPLIAPLFSGHSAAELLAGLIAVESDPSKETKDAPIVERQGYDLVRRYWKSWFDQKRGATPELGKFKDFESFFRSAVHDGWVAGTSVAPADAKLNEGGLAGLALPAKLAGLEVVFAQDDTVYDGRFANNGWLLETPKPITKITWDNAAYVGYGTALKELKLDLKREKRGDKEYIAPAKSFGITGGEHGRAYVDVIELEVGGQKQMLPVWAQPGVADGVVVVQLGYGRTRAGRVGGMLVGEGKASPDKVGNGKSGDVVGVSCYTLRSKARLWSAPATAKVTGKSHLLACVQGHHSMEQDGRPVPLVRIGTLAENAKGPGWVEGEHAGEAHSSEVPHGAPGHVHKEGEESHGEEKGRLPLTLLPAEHAPMAGYEYGKHVNRWGMVIDLNRCTGCSACVVACQSENNSPVVGKHEVSRGREMHWIRVDRYFQVNFEDLDKASEVRTYHQPVPCMQCENAPCEQVCPVAATVHSYDGLNDMVYNRCVGTRYCSNNCPYKVRRFNFLQYTDYTTPSMKLVNNPEVSVRTRGVMEKCTYCVQRIRHAEITAEKRAISQAETEKKGITREAQPKEAGKVQVRINDGEVVTACQGACPAGAIVFGDMNDPKSRIHKIKNNPATKGLNYSLLEGLNTFPRTTYLAGLRNPHPDLEAPANKG